MTTETHISIHHWGKDHYSLLAYLGTLAEDGKREIDRARVRCNIETHPLLAASGPFHPPLAWKPEWRTYLKEDHTAPEWHDDWDCLDDLDEAGLVEVISTVNGFFKITEGGHVILDQLRRHKAGGGNFKGFTPEIGGIS